MKKTRIILAVIAVVCFAIALSYPVLYALQRHSNESDMEELSALRREGMAAEQPDTAKPHTAEPYVAATAADYLFRRGVQADKGRGGYTMKRFAILLLALCLCAPSALAAGWEGDRSPAQPYVGVPEVDLDEQIGYMFFYPNPQMSLVGGGRTLYVYLPRDDAEAGEGTLYLATEDGEVWRTPFNDAQSVARHEMTEYELSSLMWGSGVCFEITLPVSLELGRHYFVNLDEGCITADGGKVANTTVGGTDAWAFDVTGDYGVSLVEYQRPVGETAEGQTPEYEGAIAAPRPGDRVRMDVVLGGEAVCASVYPNDASVQFDVSTITGSGELTGTVLTDTPSFGLVFLDAAGNVLLNIEF